MSEPCPALWSNGDLTVVLANVSYAFWSNCSSWGTLHNADQCKISQACSLVIGCAGGHPRLLIFFDWEDDKKAAEIKAQCVDFLHALAVYWETRV